MEYTVYWYKLPHHTNPYIEGYIGITNNMQRRNNEHLRNTKFSHFTNALKLYDNIIYEILNENINIDEASDIEYLYRPSTNIGWNSAIGGIDTLATLTVPIILYHESEPEKLYRFNSITEASNTLDISDGRLRQAKSRKRNHYGNDGWAICYDESEDRSKTKYVSQILRNMTLGIKRRKPSHFKGTTNRWTKEEKQRISKQHKGKTISQEQRKIVSDKNKANHTSCKSITLVHNSDTSIKHTYHSISEASRQLDIPLSRLRSKAQRPLGNYGKDGWAIINLGSE